MASTKKPRKTEIPFTPDVSVADDRDLTIRMLDEVGLNNAVRFARRADAEQVKGLFVGLQEQADRLGLKISPAMAYTDETPAGSDQVDTRSLIVWAEKVQVGDRKAKAQLAGIIATLRMRLA